MRNLLSASLTWRITGAYLLLILVVLLGLSLALSSYFRTIYQQQLEAQLAAEAAIVADEAALVLGRPAPSDPSMTIGSTLEALGARVGANSGARITLVALDGKVLSDSAEPAGEMENHAGRPEIAAALRGERGVSLRHSATVGYDMLYVAVPIRGAAGILGAARAALPLTALQQSTSALVGAVALATGVATLAAAALAVWIGRTTTRPIKELTRVAGQMSAGQLEGRVRVASRDEVGELGQAFNRMADRLEETIDTISAERNRLAAILETVVDGLLIVEPGGSVLMLNPAAERLLRVGAGQAVGRPFIEVARDHELIALLAEPGGSSRLIRLGWPRRQMLAVTAVVPDSGGQRLLLLQDVTELRRLESARRDFVANISHELRTPLAAMKAVIETLENGALDDPPAAREFLARLSDETDRTIGLVQELLELSRIESGQANIQPRPVDLRPVLESIVQRLRPLAVRAGLDLRLSLAAEPPMALADPERISQVLVSLLHNAIKFTPEGGWVELRSAVLQGEAVSWAARGAERPDPDTAPGEVLLSVVDSGVGIPPGEHERVFERFYKTDRSRSGGGTGLGLAIARHIVQAHGGRIWAESAGTRGTIFSFTLPLAVLNERDLNEPNESEAQPEDGREGLWQKS